MILQNLFNLIMLLTHFCRNPNYKVVQAILENLSGEYIDGPFHRQNTGMEIGGTKQLWVVLGLAY
jgi:hypothetical protein